VLLLSFFQERNSSIDCGKRRHPREEKTSVSSHSELQENWKLTSEKKMLNRSPREGPRGINFSGSVRQSQDDYRPLGPRIRTIAVVHREVFPEVFKRHGKGMFVLFEWLKNFPYLGGKRKKRVLLRAPRPRRLELVKEEGIHLTPTGPLTSNRSDLEGVRL